MPLVNVLPLASPGNPWSATAPQQALELITTYNLEELDALTAPPDQDIAWALRGTMTSVGTGIIKAASRMPQRMNFVPFKYGGDRNYNAVDVIATKIQPGAWDLSFGFPMIWDNIGNGWQLMSKAPDGSLIEFAGIGGMAAEYVTSGAWLRAELVASLFYNSMYFNAIGMTTPTAFCYPEPNAPNGLPLLTDGTGSDGTIGQQHYANPTMASSGRFANLFPAFGPIATNYGASLVKMTQLPHATLPNVTSGARVTDTIGPTWMRDRFWQIAVADLIMQFGGGSGGANLVAAAPSNIYSDAITKLAQAGITEENFLGTAFGPRKFWIAPQLDNHPYYTYNNGFNKTSGPNGAEADMWINISAGNSGGKPRASWAKLGCNAKDFVPTFRMYGPGDPLAMNQRMMRLEGDLDAGVSPSAYGEIQAFFGV